METTKITLNENGLNPEEFQSFVCNLINQLVISYNTQSLRSWEKNHSDNGRQWDAQVDRLIELKNRVKEEGNNGGNELFDIRLTIEIDSKTAAHRVKSEELMFQ